MKKIFWKPEEWDLLLPRAEMEFEANHGQKKWADCLDNAQRAVIDLDRQRPVSSFHSYTAKYISEQRTRAKELLAKNAAKKQEERTFINVEPLPLSQPSLVIPPPPPQLAEKIKSLLREPGIDFPARLDSILDDAVDHLMVLFEAKLRTRVQQTTMKVFGSIADIADELHHPPTPPKVVKPKLAVVGVMQKHFADYNKDFSEYFQIEFIDSHQIGQLADKLRNKDYVALNTAHVSHSASLTVKRVQPANLILAHGCNQLHDAILSFIVNSKSLANIN